ncbi:hypothetical protein D3C78_993690 [compost metagenome]
MQVAGIDRQQRRIDRRHARRQMCQGRRHARGGVIVGGQVVFHDRRAVDPGNTQQYGGCPTGAVLAGGTVEQRRAIACRQLVEQCGELASHTGIVDEGTVGLLHHGNGIGGAGEADAGDVGARGVVADDVDVAIARPLDQGVGGGGDFVRGAQVVDRLDAQAVERGQVRGRRRQRIGAVEYAAAHRTVVGGGISVGGAGDIAKVVDTRQARRIQQRTFCGRASGLGGSDGQAQNGQ